MVMGVGGWWWDRLVGAPPEMRFGEDDGAGDGGDCEGGDCDGGES